LAEGLKIILFKRESAKLAAKPDPMSQLFTVCPASFNGFNALKKNALNKPISIG